MTEVEIRNLVRGSLGQNAIKPGWLLYSGLDTLKKDDYYLMGYNPAIDPTNEANELVDTPLEKGPWSAYKHQCWRCGVFDTRKLPHKSGCRKTPKRHQKEVKKLFDVLQREAESVFSANAIFVASPRASFTTKEEMALWEQCWQVHKKFLEKVNPRFIFCLGNGMNSSSFKLLESKIEKLSEPEYVEKNDNSRRAYLNGRYFRARLGASDTACTVIGIPHPSYFCLTEKLSSFIATETAKSNGRK